MTAPLCFTDKNFPQYIIRNLSAKDGVSAVDFVKSPLNYTGGKHALLKQILPLFPKKIDTFVDIFAGGLNVGINVKANKIIANDKCQPIIELFEFFKDTPKDKIIQDIDSIISEYNLSNTSLHGYERYQSTSKDGVAKYNREQYTVMRTDYNNKKSPLLFFVLVIYSFNNQIRFNNRGYFNLPVNKRDFTARMRTNLSLFLDLLQNKNIEFFSKDYKEIEIPSSSFVYLDPPYLASLAAYNENDGWNIQKELELLDYMDNLNNKKIKFALSNVFTNKGKENTALINWSKQYNVNYLEKSYHNSNYQIKDKSKSSTIEVLITNY